MPFSSYCNGALHTIGKDLRSFYADIIRQPLPPKINAALARIDDEKSRDISLAQRAAHWCKTRPAHIS
jgi:hypothetical protein